MKIEHAVLNEKEQQFKSMIHSSLSCGGKQSPEVIRSVQLHRAALDSRQAVNLTHCTVEVMVTLQNRPL